MKKLFFALLAAPLIMSSCSSSIQKTASVQDVKSPIIAVVISDLDVSNQKISYTLKPTKKISNAGLRNCINTAISEALAAHGNGDVLIETQETIVQRYGFGRKIKSVTVTGYPAKYKNFRPVAEETVNAGIANGAFTGTSHIKK